MREELNLELGILDDIMNQPDSKEKELNLITQLMLKRIRDNIKYMNMEFKLTGHGDNSWLFLLIESYKKKYDMDCYEFFTDLNREITKYIPLNFGLMVYNGEQSLTMGPIFMEEVSSIHMSEYCYYYALEESFQNLSNEILAPFQLQIRKIDFLVEEFIYRFFLIMDYSKNTADHKMENFIFEIENEHTGTINAYYFYTVFTVLQELKKKYADKITIAFPDRFIGMYKYLQDILKRVVHIKPELVLVFGAVSIEENIMTIERKDL